MQIPRIDFRNPVAKKPDNDGLILALQSIPGLMGGSRWPDSSLRTNGGTLFNGPTWVAEGLNFASGNNHVGLPDNVLASCTAGATFAISFRGNGTDFGGTWSRLFDFGPDTTNNCYLTARSSANDIRLNIRVAGNNQEIDGPIVEANIDYRLVVTLNGQTGRIFLNGVLNGENSVTHLPSQLGATANNWLGRSQYPDPYFQGTIRQFEIYNVAVNEGWITRDYQRFLKAKAVNPCIRKIDSLAYGLLAELAPVSVANSINQDAQTLSASTMQIASAANNINQDAQTLSASAGSGLVTSARNVFIANLIRGIGL